MRLLQIHLHNWCQYEGDHFLDLDAPKSKNVILIHADNDIGKSSLFYSLAWCFHESQPDKWRKKDWPFYPLPWYQKAKQGDQIRTEVAVTFEHDKSVFCVRRSFTTQKTADSAVTVDRSFSLQRQVPGGNWGNDSEAKWNRIFPKSVLGYFIFDAETIEHFANQNENVQQSVRRLLNIEDAERAVTHLQKVATDLSKKFGPKKTNKITEYEQSILQTTALINAYKEELDHPDRGQRALLRVCREERKAVEDQLFTFKEAFQLLEEERQTGETIGQKESELFETLKKIRSVTQGLFIALVKPVAKQAFAFLEDKRTKGELPKHVKRTFVVERMQIGMCICGTPLTPGSQALNAIASFRDTLSDELSDVAQGLNNGLVALGEKAESQRSILASLIQRLSTIKQESELLKDKLKTVRSKIQARNDLPNVPDLQLRKESLESTEAIHIRRIASIDKEMEIKSKHLDFLNGLQREELRRQEHSNEAERMWILCTTAQEALQKAIENFKTKARRYLEEQCNIVGRELFWREDVYTIHISDDYVISVKSPSVYGDKDILAGMSMGVTQMTGLALIAALARQTQAQLPLIMDTPFARLGPAHITRALSECPKHFQQWILFLQPSEWRDSEYRKVVGDMIQNEFTLKRDNRTGITTAVPGYHKDYFGSTRG